MFVKYLEHRFGVSDRVVLAAAFTIKQVDDDDLLA